MLFLWGSVLYREGAGWHGNAIKKTAFRRAGPNFERPLLRAICFFCGVLKKSLQYTARRINSRSIRSERARCAGYGLVTKFSSKITNSSEIKKKRKRKLMRSGGISDEDALNRPFPFVLVVNNPNESNS
jgi:hypothetical protein